MGVRRVFAGLLVVALCAQPLRGQTPRAARAAASTDEVLARGVRVRWSAPLPTQGGAAPLVGYLEASASSAADLRAPNVGVARIKAERLARERAAERLQKALLSLPAARWERAAPSAKDLEPVLKGAVSQPEYESNGSVVLRLRVPLQALPVRLLAKEK